MDPQLGVEQSRGQNDCDSDLNTGGCTWTTASSKRFAARGASSPLTAQIVSDPPMTFERVSIGKSDGDALRDPLLGERARTVIEIGLAYGSSALAIAEALVASGSAQAHHLIIDPTRIDSIVPDGAPSSKQVPRASVCCLRSDRRSFYPAF